ncbi:MAG: hypothetical protein LBT58_02070 [Endomicrobium sp.]|nr:hypothetical protein [Endomicrobium sp.]
MKLMIDVMEVIGKNYVSETNTKDLTASAIKGVVSSLDPFSQYMEEKTFKNMKNETDCAYLLLQVRKKLNYTLKAI